MDMKTTGTFLPVVFCLFNLNDLEVLEVIVLGQLSRELVTHFQEGQLINGLFCRLDLVNLA